MDGDARVALDLHRARARGERRGREREPPARGSEAHRRAPSRENARSRHRDVHPITSARVERGPRGPLATAHELVDRRRAAVAARAIDQRSSHDSGDAFFTSGNWLA
jgi:hypothetical protein